MDKQGVWKYSSITMIGKRLLKSKNRASREDWTVGSLNLFIMGLITLFKTVLSSIPMYMRANTIIPKISLQNMVQFFKNLG